MAEWDRLPQESDSAFAAFVIYRTLPPDERSIKQTRILRDGEDKGNRNKRQFDQWASKFSWADRVAAWDIHQDKKFQREHTNVIQRDKQRILSRAYKMMDLGSELIDKAEIHNMTAAEARKKMNVAVQLVTGGSKMVMDVMGLSESQQNTIINAEEGEIAILINQFHQVGGFNTPATGEVVSTNS